MDYVLIILATVILTVAILYVLSRYISKRNDLTLRAQILQSELDKVDSPVKVTIKDMEQLRDCTHENPALQALHDSLFGWPVDPKTGKDLY